MSDKINDGGAAFPLAPVVDPQTGVFCGPRSEGMTLRDWFAGMALAEHPCNGYDYEGVAKWAYKVADAMIAEREKEAEQ